MLYVCVRVVTQGKNVVWSSIKFHAICIEEERTRTSYRARRLIDVKSYYVKHNNDNNNNIIYVRDCNMP